MNQVSATFGLAPMEGVSDWPFRLWFSLTGPLSFMSTPFLRATDTYPRVIPSDFAPDLNEVPRNYGLIPQVMASRPEDFIRTARLWLDQGAEFVDLNCGCPSPNPISGGAGSSLLRTKEGFLSFIEAISEALPPQSFSVKMRTGFDTDEAFSEMIEGLKHLPLKQLTIHGRTRRDRYDGEARWDHIRFAQTQLNYPVVASGDIVSKESWVERSRLYPEIQRVIIGRGALRNPWLFRELKGETLILSKDSLLHALAVFGLIMELSFTDFQGLLARARDGMFIEAGLDEKRWKELSHRLTQTNLFDLQTQRFAFGRVKMLWNSLRSSLPEEFFEPQLLRKKSLGEFLQAIAEIGPDRFELNHQSSLDWLYTSSRKAPTETSPPVAAADSLPS